MCDFTSTNNNDFICSPIAPPASKAEFYEIKSALLNLVMKEQFFGASTDDAASHLSNFVELCDSLRRFHSSLSHGGVGSSGRARPTPTQFFHPSHNAMPPAAPPVGATS